jgi:hypothetical protein
MLVAVHVMLATVIWWATVRLLLATRTRGVIEVLDDQPPRHRPN